MTLEIFITILVTSATATSFVIEIVKKILNKINITYKTMPLAVIIAFIVGIIELILYTTNNGNDLNIYVFLYSICMGVANTLGATCGYDTVKSLLYALNNESTN